MVTASMCQPWMVFYQCLISQAFGEMSLPLVWLAQTIK